MNNCSVIFADEFLDNCSDFLVDTFFSLFCLNIRSCRRNFAVLYVFITSFLSKFSIISLTETWLTKKIIYCLSCMGKILFLNIEMATGVGYKFLLEILLM